MKRVTFFEGIGLALGLALFTIPVSLVTAIVAPGYGVRVSFAGACCFYLLYLMVRYNYKRGRLLMALFATLSVVLASILPARFATQLVIGGTIVWGLRSLMSYRNFIPGVLDALVCFFAVVGAFWSYATTYSSLAVIWTFFLVQATSAWIPTAIVRRTSPQSPAADPFLRASEAAEAALVQIIRRCTQP